jgi:minor extracellular serine protease Vpr
MKKTLLIGLLCIAPTLAFAQIDLDKLDKSSIGKDPVEATNEYEFSSKMSNETGMLYGEIVQQKRIAKAKNKSLNSVVSQDSTLRKRYMLRTHDEVSYVGAFVELHDATDCSAFDAHGVEYVKPFGDIFICQIPVTALGELADEENVKRIEIAQRVYPMLDNARTDANVEDVYNGTNLPTAFTGKDVIVGIIDEGFDFTHPNFYTTDKSEYRIKRVWDQNSDDGTAVTVFGNTVSLGSEFTTEAEILKHATDNTSESHATHVTGIAAGSGCISNSKYRGVAPDADIVAVATNMSNNGITQGIGYILEYATSQGKPCVINMSLGSHQGPHDGTSYTSNFLKTISNTFPNLALVGSAGNEGGDKIHISKNFSKNDTIKRSNITTSSTSKKCTQVNTLIDIWGDAPFAVSVNIYNTEDKKFEDYTPYVWVTNTAQTKNYTLEDKDPLFSDECKVTMSLQTESNGKYHATVTIDNTDQDDSYRYAQLDIKSYDATVHAWINGQYTNFTNGDTDYTVGEVGGISEGIISVGAYTSKNQYESISQGTQKAGFYTDNGEIAPFSSKGPTVDGRMKPDIAAPGNVVVSSVNSYDTDNYGKNGIKTVASYTNNGATHYFGTMQGTSQASPFVAGVVATWMQADPTLNTYEVRDILRTTAVQDSYTGTCPNNTWGYGKIDAYAGLVEVIRRRAQREAENNRNFVIVAKREKGNYFYMTSNLFKNKRFNAADAGTDDLTKIVTENLPDSLVWTCDLRGTTTKLQHGTQYVSWKSGNTAILDATGRELIISFENGIYGFYFADTDTTERLLSLNNTAGNDYFAFYREGQIAELYLLPCTTASSDKDEDDEDTRDCTALPFSESFASSSQGKFTVYDVITASTDKQTWKSTAQYGMKIGGQVSGANVAAESWLISPCINLSSATQPQLTFDHAHRYAGTPANELTLWISTDYTTGAPSTATWKQLTIPQYNTNTNWNFVSSNAIDLSSYKGKNICLAWKYTSSTTAAATWEVKNVVVAEKGASTAISGAKTSDIIAIGLQGEIDIFGTQAGQNVEVYTIAGLHLMTRQAQSDFISLRLPAGFYLVKVDNTIHKVVVQ